jgi:hypothetical protein
MMESEFRDWTRGQLRSLDERLRRLAERPLEPAREAIDAKLAGTMAEMAEEVSAAVRDRRVRGLGIVLVTDDGGTNMGFAATDGGHFRLAGAVQLLGLTIVNERIKLKDAANDSEPAGHAGADQAPAAG